MRTLSEIIEAVKSNEVPDKDEMFYSILALSALYTFNELDLMHLAQKPHAKFMTPMKYYEEAFNRGKKAMQKDPKTWVGWNNDPANPEYQRERKIFHRFAEKLLNDSIQEGKTK